MWPWAMAVTVALVMATGSRQKTLFVVESMHKYLQTHIE